MTLPERKRRDPRFEDLELHIGQDYAVAMLPRETTETATVNFGRCQDGGAQRAVRRFVRRYNTQPDLVSAGNLALDQLQHVALSIKKDQDPDLHAAIRALKLALRKAKGS